jgi:hypothetical protein
MARRDDAHVRPDHHIVGNIEAAKVIESAILIDENIAPDTDIDPPVVWKGGINKKLSSTFFPIRSLNKARTSSTSLNVKRLN